MITPANASRSRQARGGGHARSGQGQSIITRSNPVRSSRRSLLSRNVRLSSADRQTQYTQLVENETEDPTEEEEESGDVKTATTQFDDQTSEEERSLLGAGAAQQSEDRTPVDRLYNNNNRVESDGRRVRRRGSPGNTGKAG